MQGSSRWTAASCLLNISNDSSLEYFWALIGCVVSYVLEVRYRFSGAAVISSKYSLVKSDFNKIISFSLKLYFKVVKVSTVFGLKIKDLMRL